MNNIINKLQTGHTLIRLNDIPSHNMGLHILHGSGSAYPYLGQGRNNLATYMYIQIVKTCYLKSSNTSNLHNMYIVCLCLYNHKISRM